MAATSAKALALGACLTSLSQPVLQTAVKGAAETEKLAFTLIEELRNVMFLVGAEKRRTIEDDAPGDYRKNK